MAAVPAAGSTETRGVRQSLSYSRPGTRLGDLHRRAVHKPTALLVPMQIQSTEMHTPPDHCRQVPCCSSRHLAASKYGALKTQSTTGWPLPMNKAKSYIPVPICTQDAHKDSTHSLPRTHPQSLVLPPAPSAAADPHEPASASPCTPASCSGCHTHCHHLRHPHPLRLPLMVVLLLQSQGVAGSGQRRGLPRLVRLQHPPSPAAAERGHTLQSTQHGTAQPGIQYMTVCMYTTEGIESDSGSKQ